MGGQSDILPQKCELRDLIMQVNKQPWGKGKTRVINHFSGRAETCLFLHKKSPGNRHLEAFDKPHQSRLTTFQFCTRRPKWRPRWFGSTRSARDKTKNVTLLWTVSWEPSTYLVFHFRGESVGRTLVKGHGEGFKKLRLSGKKKQHQVQNRRKLFFDFLFQWNLNK